MAVDFLFSSSSSRRRICPNDVHTHLFISRPELSTMADLMGEVSDMTSSHEFMMDSCPRPM